MSLKQARGGQVVALLGSCLPIAATKPKVTYLAPHLLPVLNLPIVCRDHAHRACGTRATSSSHADPASLLPATAVLLTQHPSRLSDFSPIFRAATIFLRGWSHVRGKQLFISHFLESSKF